MTQTEEASSSQSQSTAATTSLQLYDGCKQSIQACTDDYVRLTDPKLLIIDSAQHSNSVLENCYVKFYHRYEEIPETPHRKHVMH